MEDIMKSLREEGFAPEETTENEFEPITGKYVCRIDSVSHLQGKAKSTGSDYDFRAMNLQVVEVIEGDKATNRFIKISYSSDTKGIKKLLNDLFTAGINVTAGSDAELDEFLMSLKDKTLNVRCWVWSPENDRNGNPIPSEARKSYQQTRVVKDAKAKKSESSTANKADTPF